MENLFAYILHPRKRSLSEEGVSLRTSQRSNLIKGISEIFVQECLVGKIATDDHGVCCVCLSMMKAGDEARRLKCRHLFHRLCIDRWLGNCRRTCPLCRLPVDDGASSQMQELTEEMVIWFSSFHVAGF